MTGWRYSEGISEGFTVKASGGGGGCGDVGVQSSLQLLAGQKILGGFTRGERQRAVIGDVR